RASASSSRANCARRTVHCWSTSRIRRVVASSASFSRIRSAGNGDALVHLTERFTARQTAILAVFTLSGFTGLIYESIWSHYLRIFLGHAAYAQTLVLAIFMGGMAIGAWLVGRQSTRVRRLLFGYALVELLIGLLGLAFHPAFENFLE